MVPGVGPAHRSVSVGGVGRQRPKCTLGDPLGNVCLLCLGRGFGCLFALTFDQILELSAELDTGILDDFPVLALELLSAVFCLEGRYNVSKIFKFPEETLVLTSALNGRPGLDKLGHLFEYFAGS